MRSIKEGNSDKIITEKFNFDFELEADALCLIEIIASAKSWWQNFKSLRSFLKDDDIVLTVDRLEITTSRSRDADVRPAWNGNELKGLLKTVVVAIKLKKGKHALHLTPDQSPYLKSIKVSLLETAGTIIYLPGGNNPAQTGQGRPWISFVLINLSASNLAISATVNKKEKDDDDLKLILDGEIQKNQIGSSHKDWFWCGKINKGEEKPFSKSVSWNGGFHYLDLYADESPFLKNIILELKENKNLDKLSPQYIISQINKFYEEIGIRIGSFKIPKVFEDSSLYSVEINQAAKEFNIDPIILKATLAQESSYGKNVDHDKRYVGESGLMGLEKKQSIKKLDELGYKFDYEKIVDAMRASAAYYNWVRERKTIVKFDDKNNPLKLYTQYRWRLDGKGAETAGIPQFLYHYLYFKNQ